MRRFLWTSYGMYFMGGVISVFFGSIMPELVAHYHVSYASGGFLILLQSVGFIAGVPLTAWSMKRFHYRFILSGCALAVAVAQGVILFLPSLTWVYVLVILNGLGGAGLETAVASYVMELFEGRRAIFMSRLEVSFGAGALSMPVVASALIAFHQWRFTSLILSVFALVLALLWQSISVSLSPTEMEGHMDARTAAPPVFRGKVAKYSVLFLFLLMIFVYVGVEGSLNSFLPTIFMVHLNLRPSIASLSSSTFWIAMVFGRMAIGWIVRRVTYENYILASLTLGILLFLLLAGLRSPFASYVTVFGLGLALSAVYSITMVYANHTFPRMERTVTSAVTAFAGMGGATFPAAIGFAMDHLSPTGVLWLVVAFSAALLILFLAIYGSLWFIRRKRVEVPA